MLNKNKIQRQKQMTITQTHFIKVIFQYITFVIHQNVSWEKIQIDFNTVNTYFIAIFLMFLFVSLSTNSQKNYRSV